MGNDPCMPIICDLLMLSIFVLSESFSGSFSIVVVGVFHASVWPSYDLWKKMSNILRLNLSLIAIEKHISVRHVEKITRTETISV